MIKEGEGMLSMKIRDFLYCSYKILSFYSIVSSLFMIDHRYNLLVSCAAAELYVGHLASDIRYGVTAFTLLLTQRGMIIQSEGRPCMYFMEYQIYGIWHM